MPGKSLARAILEEELREAAQIALGINQGKYYKAFDRRAHGYALVGHTNEEIAELLGVSATTFDEWIAASESLRRALQKARHDDYVRVVRSAHRAANGFRAREDKLLVVGGKVERHVISKVYPPNMVATTLLLTNRQGERWKDKRVGDASVVTAADLLEAIEEVAQRRAARLPGDGAKVIDGTATKDDGGEETQ